ncbi:MULTISPECIES: SPOR domain-containing protein [unclassified Paenibacillus]|uniref:SPOR domain-containing protein n=1 Tax=unclassified Paenibacillus TaxID=185978 RepID=UPI00363FB0C2
MNNAKMTFRFENGKHKNSGRVVKEQPKVIPLHNEEYTVIRSEDVDAEQTSVEMESVATPPSSRLHNSRSETFIDAQPLNQYTNDFGGWQSSFDTETQRVEKLIRESAKVEYHPETGYMDNQNNRNVRRDDESEYEPIRDHRWYVPEETVYVSQSSGSSWLKVAASVAGAVVTGIAFGFFVLSMFSQDTQSPKGGNTSPPAGAAGSTVASTQTNGTAVTKLPVSSSANTGQAAAPVMAPVTSGSPVVTAVNIPGKTIAFLQSGVFSTPQAADTAQAELKKKGLAAVSDSGDKFPVYVGMSMTRDEALGLAQQFQQKKTDVIIKSIELPALTKIKWSAKPSEGLSVYLSQGDKLLQTLTPLTLTHLTQAQPAALDAAALQSIKTAHQTWTGLAAGANEGLADEARASVQKMSNAMNTAVASLDEYKKNPSQSYMWQTQNAMMQYVLAQKELRKLVSAQ